MDRKRKAGHPWTVALLIVAFSCLIAFGGARVYHLFHQTTPFEYRTFDIGGNEGLEVLEDGFVYYDGSTITMVSTEAKAKWNYYFGADAGFHATNYGVAA